LLKCTPLGWVQYGGWRCFSLEIPKKNNNNKNPRRDIRMSIRRRLEILHHFGRFVLDNLHVIIVPPERAVSTSARLQTRCANGLAFVFPVIRSSVPSTFCRLRSCTYTIIFARICNTSSNTHGVYNNYHRTRAVSMHSGFL